MNDRITLFQTDKTIALATPTSNSLLGEYRIDYYTNKENISKEKQETWGSWANNTMYCTTSPTGNCQFGSLAYAANILYLKPDEAKLFFRAIKNSLTAKPMLFMDISASYESHADTLFTGNIVVKTPYISTNKSSMILYLVKINF